MSTNEKGTPQSRTYTVNDIAAILGIGRASAYKLANLNLSKRIIPIFHSISIYIIKSNITRIYRQDNRKGLLRSISTT